MVIRSLFTISLQEHFDPVLPLEEISREANLDPFIARDCALDSGSGGMYCYPPELAGPASCDPAGQG
jgi:hypothetical protein